MRRTARTQARKCSNHKSPRFLRRWIDGPSPGSGTCHRTFGGESLRPPYLISSPVSRLLCKDEAKTRPYLPAWAQKLLWTGLYQRSRSYAETSLNPRSSFFGGAGRIQIDSGDAVFRGVHVGRLTTQGFVRYSWLEPTVFLFQEIPVIPLDL